MRLSHNFAVRGCCDVWGNKQACAVEPSSGARTGEFLKGASEADRSHTPANRVRLSALHPIYAASLKTAVLKNISPLPNVQNAPVGWGTLSTGSVITTTSAKRRTRASVLKSLFTQRPSLRAEVAFTRQGFARRSNYFSPSTERGNRNRLGANPTVDVPVNQKREITFLELT